ncbi:MAG: non-ribosomal peptide synthetase, partial [Deltaproteobacteria bacterium]|nr:non-ribosomal peptide synthetase [Deltaproteobacteria bacterium]
KVKKDELKDIAAGILRNITEGHGINAARIVLIKARTIPKTTSGKIRRKMCKMALLNNKLAVVYQWQDKKSAEAVGGKEPQPKKDGLETNKGGSRTSEEVYGWLLERINTSSADVITMENLKEKSLADTGLDSVDQVELVTDFEEKFDCVVDIDELMQTTSLAEFSLALYQAACPPSS